jgi:hypothetical protein
MERVKEGDVIVNEDGFKAKIIFANKEYFVRSGWDYFTAVNSLVYPQSDLQANNWKKHNPDDDLIEVCCEGKKVKITRAKAKEIGLC